MGRAKKVHNGATAPWLQWELSFLIENYNHMPDEELIKHLNDRSVVAVRSKLNALRLKRALSRRVEFTLREIFKDLGPPKLNTD